MVQVKQASLLASVAGFVLACAPNIAQAQDKDKKAEDDPVIVVSGTGLDETPASPAYATQTIDRQTLIAAPSGRIEEVLSNIAGFQQFRRSDSRSANPSSQGATLRALGGNASSRALVLLDGVPMSDPFFGYIPFTAIAPERLGSVRITRGGGSGPFGAGALAGTIELISANADTLGSFSGELLVNNRGESEASASVASRLGAGFGSVSGRWDRGKGFWTTPEADRVPISARAAFDSYSFQTRAVAPLTDSVEIQARGLVFHDTRTLRFDGAESSMEGQDASLRLIGKGDWQFEALGYIQARNFTNVIVSSTHLVPVLDQRNTPSTGIGGKIELRPPTGESNLLRFGLDYRRSDGELFETMLSSFTGAVTARRNAGGSNSDLGLFIENDFTIGTLTLTAGGRLDRFTIRDGFYHERNGANMVEVNNSFPDRAGWETSFRGGALFRAGEGLRLRAAAYTGLRLPTLNELYRPFVIFPVTTNANAALKNERLIGFEAGADFEYGEALEMSFTMFDNTVEDAIANVTLDALTRQRQNVDSIHARGLEANASLNLGKFSFLGAISYTDASVQQPNADFDGNRPQQTPRWIGGATVSYRPADNWLFSATLRHVGTQFEDDLESDILPAVTTLHAFMQIPISDVIALVIRGENVTDEQIITRNQSGSVDLGVPRTIWVGIKYGL